MPIQLSVAVRNARANAVETTIGTAPRLQLRSGAPPANTAAADTGTLLCEITLPSDWMADAASGSKLRLGTWSGTGAAAGTAAHFRIKDTPGTTTHMQGTVSGTGGGGDLTLDNPVIASGQAVSIATFTLNEPNA